MRYVFWPVALLLAHLPVSAQVEIAFPQIIVGESFETVVQIANDVASDDTLTFEVYSGALEDNGLPMPVQFDGGSPAAIVQRQLGPFQELSVRLDLGGSDLRVGWVRVSSSAAGGRISGSLFYRVKSGDKVLESVGVTSSRRYRFAQIQLYHKDQGSDTGVGFINPDGSAVEVTIDLFRGEEFLAQFVHTLQPGQHFARLVSEIFPDFTGATGTLIVETSASRAIPFLTLRLDGEQLTSLPVRPLGFSLHYEVWDQSSTLVESGFWVLESEGHNIVGFGRRSGDSESERYRVLGSWEGTSFQCAYRTKLPDDSIGVFVFNGTSKGVEKSEGEPITGKATMIGADGQAVAVYEFSAFSKY
jgi:hypothetical protein